MIRIQNNPHLFRDADSKGIINTDIASLQEHRNRRKFAMDMNTINSEITGMKNDINDIKTLLHALLNK